MVLSTTSLFLKITHFRKFSSYAIITRYKFVLNQTHLKFNALFIMRKYFNPIFRVCFTASKFIFKYVPILALTNNIKHSCNSNPHAFRAKQVIISKNSTIQIIALIYFLNRF